MTSGQFTSLSRGESCFRICFPINPGSDRFDISDFKMSSLESSYRGASAATPDPATYYRRRYLCASPSGGGKGKRHPGKAILAGTYSSRFLVIYQICHCKILFHNAMVKVNICSFLPVCGQILANQRWVYEIRTSINNVRRVKLI